MNYLIKFDLIINDKITKYAGRMGVVIAVIMCLVIMIGALHRLGNLTAPSGVFPQYKSFKHFITTTSSTSNYITSCYDSNNISPSL